MLTWDILTVPIVITVRGKEVCRLGPQPRTSKGSAAFAKQRTSWGAPDAIPRGGCSYMCKTALLWLSVITHVPQQYCICDQIWHSNVTMCNMKQWALKWGSKKIITYTFLLLMAHLSNVFPLMISYKVHVQSSCRKKKIPAQYLAPKTTCRGVRQRAPSHTEPYPLSFTRFRFCWVQLFQERKN